MKPERQSRVEQLVQEALELEENERGEFLERHCAGDQSLRCEVESLLAFEKDADRFMEASAVQVAAEALAKESCLTQNSQVAQDDALEGQTISHYRILSKAGCTVSGLLRSSLLLISAERQTVGVTFQNLDLHGAGIGGHLHNLLHGRSRMVL